MILKVCSFILPIATHAFSSSSSLRYTTISSSSLLVSSPSIETSSTSENSKKEIKASKWFPIRAQDSLTSSYNTIVKSAYLRHILVETEAMADVLLQQYLSNPSEKGSADPFGDLARNVSSCIYSRDDGGRIGWVDNPFFKDANENLNSSASKMNNEMDFESIHIMTTKEVVSKLFEKRPKGGDIYKISGDLVNGDSDMEEPKTQWHLIQINDIMTFNPLTSVSPASSEKSSGNKFIVNRPKLKGLGIQPRTPSLTSNDDSNNKKTLTYHIATTGCQMNTADSERMEGILKQNLGFTPLSDVIEQQKQMEESSETETPSKKKKKKKLPQPDVVLFNTCTIRDHAEQKLYDALGPIANRKRQGESVALIVAGCVAQQEGEQLIKRFPEIDLVMGPQYISRMEELMEDVMNWGHQIVAVDPMLWSESSTSSGSGASSASGITRGHNVRAWVNIIQGCNEHCTYCVVPGVRGVEQSRSMESILQEINNLNADTEGKDSLIKEDDTSLFVPSYKEITLLGQNIDAYGRDMIPRRSFADLLHYLNDNVASVGIERIRYVTSHPRYFSDRVIDAVANLDRVMECFHMPFQSGDDKVLQDMRRGYTFSSYMKIIDKIKDKAPDASICGDVIVGFPGETDEAFQRTLDLMEEVKFDNLNTFAYSPRPNTEAALWDNQIPEEVKSERLQMVQRLATTHALERSERYLNTIAEVLVEDVNPRNRAQVMGRTRQGRQVYFDGDIEDLMGKIVSVLITEARPWSLMGSLV